MSNAQTVDEVLEVAAQVLIRCTVMGIVVLLIWWAALGFAGDLAYRAHASLFPMSRQQFDLIHYYVAMLVTKAAVSLLFFLPYIAIRLVVRKRKKPSSSRRSGGAVQ